MALVDMKMSAEEAKEQYEPTAADAPEYPYGLQLSLDEEGLARLGITTPPAVGTVMTLTARVEVCSTSAYKTQGGDNESSTSLQITAMQLSGASDSAGQDAASVLYGG